MRGALHLGPFHPHLESAFAARLRELAPQGDARRVLVVVPNRLLAVHLRRRAAELGAPTVGLAPRTLEDLQAELAAPLAEREGWRELPDWALALVLRRVLPGVKRSSFAPLAERAGLYRALAATLRDLRDADLDPAALAEAVRVAGSTPKLTDLVRFHRAFAEHVVRARLLDGAARAELALRALAAQPGLVPRRVLVYGFYDLVGRQRRFLHALLAGRDAEIFFPWAAGRGFEYAAKLRDWFERQGFAPHLPAPSGDGSPPATDRERLLRYLFALDTPPGRSAPDGSVRFLATPNPARESLELLRDLVRDPPGSALVLLRHEDEGADRLRGAARRAAVPLHVTGPALASTPGGRAALSLLGLVARRTAGEEDLALPRREVEALLASDALDRRRLEHGGHPERWTQLLRRRGLLGRLEEWRDLVERYATPQESLPFGSERAAGGENDEEDRFLDAKLRAELVPLGRFAEALLGDLELAGASLRRGWPALAEAARRLVATWLVPGEETDAVLAALADLAALHGVLPASGPALREAAAALLERPLRQDGPRFGDAPSVVGLAAARGVTAERVLLPGLLEGSFPRRAREDPVLLDEERRRLNAVLPAETELPLLAESSPAEERLLFRLAVGAARSELVLAWPKRGAGGRQAAPSLYLLEAARALLGRHLDLHGLYGEPALALRNVGLQPPYPARPEDGPPLVAAEYDLREIDAVRETRDAAAGERLSYLLGAYPRFAEALRGELRRHGFATRGILTEYDGAVGARLGSALVASLRRADGAVRMSPSALASYARCSFHFLLERGLRARHEEPPEAALDPSAAELGTVYHELLRELFARLGAERLLPLAEAGVGRAREIAAALVEASARLAELVPGPLLAARRARVRDDLWQLLERTAGEPWTPRELEFEIGGPDSPAVAVGRWLLAARGRIDRLDEGPRGLRIVDYKTGKLPRAKAPDLEGGRQLQLYVYQLLVAAERQARGEGVRPIHGVLLGVTPASRYGAVEWSDADFKAAAADFAGILEGILGGVERGELFQVENNSFCDEICAFGAVCGPSRRSLVAGKSQDPAAAAARAWRFPDEAEP